MDFKFKQSLGQDIWNWQEVATKQGTYGQNWRKDWPKDLALKDARDKKKIKAYLQNKYYREKAVKKYSEWLQVAIRPEVINDILLRITGKEVPFKNVKVFITTARRCPYDPVKGTFFVHYGASKSWIYKISTHECMHLIIHRYYWKKIIGSGLSEQQAHDIKEALTVLINPIFIKNWNLSEKGYPNHQSLRKDIEKIASKSDNFDLIIENTIKLFKKKYFKKVS